MRSFVLGLVTSYGLSTTPATASSSAAAPPTSVRARSAVNGTLQLSATVRSTPGSVVGGSSSNNPCASRVDAEGDPRITGLRAGPLEALRPFLQEHAEHFWHELRWIHFYLLFPPENSMLGWCLLTIKAILITLHGIPLNNFNLFLLSCRVPSCPVFSYICL